MFPCLFIEQTDYSSGPSRREEKIMSLTLEERCYLVIRWFLVERVGTIRSV